MKIGWPLTDNRALRLMLKSACTIGLLCLIFSQVNLGHALRQLGSIGVWQLAGSSIVLFGLLLPTALRWTLVMRALRHDLPLRYTWPGILHASFFNQALPSTMGGDIVRMAGSYAAGLSVRDAVGGVVIDRLSAFISLMVLIALMAPVTLSLFGVGLSWGIITLASAALTAVLCVVALGVISRAPHRSGWLQAFTYISRGLYQVFSDLRSGAEVTLVGLFIHVLRVIAIWILADGLHIEVDFLHMLAIAPIALLAAMVPISIGGWGVREVTFLYGLGLVGVSTQDAVLISVTFGLVSIVTSLPGGLLWFQDGWSRRETTQFRRHHGTRRY
jgi:uncharacterized protein (TIRG00374 family)